MADCSNGFHNAIAEYLHIRIKFRAAAACKPVKGSGSIIKRRHAVFDRLYIDFKLRGERSARNDMQNCFSARKCRRKMIDRRSFPIRNFSTPFIAKLLRSLTELVHLLLFSVAGFGFLGGLVAHWKISGLFACHNTTTARGAGGEAEYFISMPNPAVAAPRFHPYNPPADAPGDPMNPPANPPTNRLCARRRAPIACARVVLV